MTKNSGVEPALVEEPSDIAGAPRQALSKDVPYRLEVRTRCHAPMPRTGYWDIADFLRVGNE